jgi:hypothetical protein
MAKTRDPLHSSEASGAIGGNVYRPHRGSHLVYPKSSVSAAQTPARLNSQQCLIAALKAWQAMPHADQQKWIALAGPGGCGSSLYIGRKARSLKYGLWYEPQPYNVAAVPLITVGAIHRDNDFGPRYYIEHTPATGDDWWIVLYVCRLPAVHRKPDNKRFVFRVIDNPYGEYTSVEPDPDGDYAIAVDVYLYYGPTSEQFYCGRSIADRLP